jgi:glucarate dehydratase
MREQITLLSPGRSQRFDSSEILSVVHRNQDFSRDASHSSPHVTNMRVIPVAGNDSMLLNLSGAHAPFFTRNVVVLTDDAGHTGAGEVPGGEKIRQVLEEAGSAIVGRAIASYH